MEHKSRNPRAAAGRGINFRNYRFSSSSTLGRSRANTTLHDNQRAQRRSRSRSRSPFGSGHEHVRGANPEHFPRKSSAGLKPSSIEHSSAQRDYFKELYGFSLRNNEPVKTFRGFNSEHNQSSSSSTPEPNFGINRPDEIDLRCLKQIEPNERSRLTKIWDDAGCENRSSRSHSHSPSSSGHEDVRGRDLEHAARSCNPLFERREAKTEEGSSKCDVNKFLLDSNASIFSTPSQPACAIVPDPVKQCEAAAMPEGPKNYQLPFDSRVVSFKLTAGLLQNGFGMISTTDMEKMVHFFTLLVKTRKVCPESDRSSYWTKVQARLGIKRENANATELAKEIKQSNMEALTDTDLQALLPNFQFLNLGEQQHLIACLKKLETIEPYREQRLRRYLNISELKVSCSDFLSVFCSIAKSTADGLSLSTASAAMSDFMGQCGYEEHGLQAPGAYEMHNASSMTHMPQPMPQYMIMNQAPCFGPNFGDFMQETSSMKLYGVPES